MTSQIGTGPILRARPQWSPPFRGGMTVRDRCDADGDAHAAMEPALQGRDDGPVAPARAGHELAPQWSPPFRGGMTTW